MDRTATGILHLFGWGLVLVALAILAIVEVVLTRPVLFLRYWNKWIGAFILLAAVWGFLAFFPGSGRLEDFNLGGEIGQRISGGFNPAGVFIVLGLIFAGIFFVAPRGFAHFIANFLSWAVRPLKKEPLSSQMPLPQPSTSPRINTGNVESELRSTVFPKYKQEPRPKPLAPVNGSKNWLWNRLHPGPVPVTPVQTTPSESLNTEVDKGTTEAIPETESQTKEPETSANGKLPANGKNMKQKAEEVWKKYGEAAVQITADGWKLPPIEILDNAPEIEFSQVDNMKKAKLIEDALSSYGVESKVVQINVGPTVTQFGIEPGWDRKLKEIKEKDKNGDVRIKVEEVNKTRVKVDRITSLSNDLSMALAAPSIRIEAPVLVNRS
jgi:S-DNA-T family DNA segregation ATPase FtsK/SpoIIIE